MNHSHTNSIMSDKILIEGAGNFMPEVPKDRPLTALIKMCRKHITGMARWQFVLSAALLLTFLSVALLASALSTEHWVNHHVDRESLTNKSLFDSYLKANLKNNPVYFSRNRGLFRSCFEGNDASKMLSERNDVTNNVCLDETGFSLKSDSSNGTAAVVYDQYYTTRMHLLRTIVAFTMASLLLYFISIILGIITAFVAHLRLVTFTSLLIFSGLIFSAFGMALFFVVHYLENKRINLPDFRGGWLVGSEHEFLIKAATEDYGYSIIIGWVSLIPAGVAVVLCIVAAHMGHKYIEEKNRPKSWYETVKSDKSKSSKINGELSTRDSDIYYSHSIDRNLAYEYVERVNPNDAELELSDNKSEDTSYS